MNDGTGSGVALERAFAQVPEIAVSVAMRAGDAFRHASRDR